MGYLLRTKEDYRLCYGEPKNPYIISSSGSYFSIDDYQKIMDEEVETSICEDLISDYIPIHGWADVVEGDNGIVITSDMAEYILDGEVLKVDEWVEVGKLTR